jgi:hypothetical protein
MIKHRIIIKNIVENESTAEGFLEVTVENGRIYSYFSGVWAII